MIFAPFAVASVARAQEAPAPTPAEDDDLELPATSTPPPPAEATPASPPAPSPPAPAPPPAAPPPSTASESELAELQKRIAALEAAASEPAPHAEVPSLPLGIKISGYFQGQFETSQLSEDQLQQGGEPLNQDRFLVRRGRIRFDRGWQYAAASLELDANTTRGVTVGIRRAESTLLYRESDDPDAKPLVAVTLGVTDIPFGYDLLESARQRPFMERNLGSGALFPTEADAGVKVWGSVAFLRYAVALMNGEPLDSRGFPRDPNAAKDVIGRVGVEVPVAPVLTITGGTSFAVGKGFHPGASATKDSVVWSDLNGDGAVGPGELIGVTGSAATPSSNFDRWAFGLDLGLSLKTGLGETKLYGEAFVASNYDRGLVRADPVSNNGIDLRHAGGFAAVLQDVTRYGRVGFRASYYDPNSDLFEDRRGRTLPLDQGILTLSPLVGVGVRDRAQLFLQYDFVRDKLGRDDRGVPADVENDVFTARLQVEL